MPISSSHTINIINIVTISLVSVEIVKYLVEI